METVKMTKKTPKVIRKTLKERLEESRAAGYIDGFTNGGCAAKAAFGPNFAYGDGINDFIRMVQSWPLAENAVISVAGTDLRINVSATIPARLFMAIVTELRRLGYSGQ